VVYLLKKASAFILLFAALSFAFSARAVSAKAYALVDQASGRLICGQNTDLKLPMASTTKIMTALIACESGKLDMTFTVDPDAVRVEGSSMGLLPGERITLRELVYGLLLESGNDAANAIAYELGGSIPGFADMMNKRAKQLGLSNTHFINPSGLDASGHYTTALDLARLGAYAMKNPDFARISGTKKMCISYNGIKNGRTLYNHNKLLSSVDGINGIKTGFTKKSGRCLVSSATRGGVSLVVATLDDPDDWDDHEQFLDYGFKLLKCHALLNGPLNISAKVVGGTVGTIKAEYDVSVSAALSDSEAGGVTMEIDMPGFIYAPVKKGQKIGELVFKVNGQAVAVSPLTAAQGITAQCAGADAGGRGFINSVIILVAGVAVFFIINRFFGSRKAALGIVRRLKEK